MKRLTTALIVLMLGLTMALTGCGQTNSSSHKDESGKTSSSTIDSKTVQAGLNKLLASSKQLKAAIKEGHDDQVKKLGPTLEDEWSSFEDAIKAKYPDSYEEVEKYLDPAIAGSKVTPVDQKSLSPLVDQLIKAVQDLDNKINQ